MFDHPVKIVERFFQQILNRSKEEHALFAPFILPFDSHDKLAILVVCVLSCMFPPSNCFLTTNSNLNKQPYAKFNNHEISKLFQCSSIEPTSRSVGQQTTTNHGSFQEYTHTNENTSLSTSICLMLWHCVECYCLSGQADGGAIIKFDSLFSIF